MATKRCIGLRYGQADNALPHSNAGANHSTSMSQDSASAASMPQVWSMMPHSSFNSTNSLQPFLHTMLSFATISTHSAYKVKPENQI